MSFGGMDIWALIESQNIFPIKTDDKLVMKRQEKHHIFTKFHFVTTESISIVVNIDSLAFGTGIED